MKIPFTHNHRGFTLIETLFAILIFSASLVSLMTIAASGISATANVRQETTAHYLAQEGLEVVRNIRDTNYGITSAVWDAGFSQCATSPCNLVYSTGAPAVPTIDTCTIDPATGGCPVNESNGYFVSGSGTPSEYGRVITVTPEGTNSDEYLVKSTVTWTAKPLNRTVTLETILKNWQ